MEAILLGLVIFNAFFSPSDSQFDTFEIAQTNFKQNSESQIDYPNNEFESFSGLSLGSREYSQATPYFRYGTATYIYGQTSTQEDASRTLKQNGGYAGFMFEFNYERYIGVGTIIGGGATFKTL